MRDSFSIFPKPLSLTLACFFHLRYSREWACPAVLLTDYQNSVYLHFENLGNTSYSSLNNEADWGRAIVDTNNSSCEYPQRSRLFSFLYSELEGMGLQGRDRLPPRARF